MSEAVALIVAQLDLIGVEYERTGPRGLAIRVPTRMRGPLAVGLDCGERTLGMRAFILRAPDRDAEGVYRRALRRNLETAAWRFAVDDDGDIFLVARLGLDGLGTRALDEVLGELSVLVDSTYDGLMRAGFDVPDDAPVGAPPGVPDPLESQPDASSQPKRRASL